MSSDSVEHFPQVCIIESPSDRDVLDGRNEGEALSRALRLANVRNNHYAVTTARTLNTCLERMVEDPAIVEKEGVPQFPMLYIHISAHENADGIALTNSEFIPWMERTSMYSDALLLGMRRTSRCHYDCGKVDLSILWLGWTENTCGLGGIAHGLRRAVPQRLP